MKSSVRNYKYIFSKALSQVLTRDESIIKSVIDVAKKENEKARGESGFHTKLSANSTVDQGISQKLAQGYANYSEVRIATRAKDMTWEDVKAGQKGFLVDSRVTDVAPTIIHELTHLALERMYEFGSKPWYEPFGTRAKETGPEQKYEGIEKLANKHLGWPGNDIDKIIEEFERADFSTEDIARNVQKQFKGYPGDEKSKEIVSHLVELLYRLGKTQGEKILKKTCPKGWELLELVQGQAKIYIEWREKQNKTSST